MSTYLVTGGAGFIGSHIAEYLVRKGQDVRVLDNVSTGKLENIELLGAGVDFVQGDIRDRDTVDEATRGADYVIHQAALASVPRSIDEPTPTNQVNVQGTLNLLEAAKAHGVKKFVYASSSSVYGDSEELPKREDMAVDPRSPYAISKLAGEFYCRVFGSLYDLPTVSLRYFNVFGPRQDPNSEYSAVIPLFLKALIGGGPPTIYGDGEQSRDFTYIDNVVAANILSCESSDRGGKVYNVACGETFTLNFLYDRLKNTIGVDYEAIYGPPRPGDVKHSQAAIERITSDLGFQPEVDFETGLKQTVEWFSSSDILEKG